MNCLGLEQGLIISIPVRDLEKSAAWYRDVMGFELALELKSPPWYELFTSTEGVRLGLAQVQKVNPGETTPIFRVASLEVAEAALAAKQIATSEVVAVPGQAKLLTLHDPDGNTLMLEQLL